MAVNPNQDNRPGPVLIAATATAVISIGLLFVMILASAAPVISSGLSGEEALFSWAWNPGRGQFGLLPMVAGSLMLAVTATVLAWPLALGLCALLVAGDGGPRRSPARLFTIILSPLVRFMTAVPTVIYGFVAVFLLVPLMRTVWGRGSGLGLATAALVLTLLILPTMILVLEAGLKDRYQKIRLDAAALGFGPLETLAHWVLPRAGSTLVSALVLGFGRAIGDTLISLMLAGNAPQTPAALTDSFRTLTAHMALVTANEVSGAAYNSLFAAGALILVISCGVSFLLRGLISRNREAS